MKVRTFFLFQTLDVLRRTAENIKDPLFRFFEREVSHFSAETQIQSCYTYVLIPYCMETTGNFKA